MTTRKKAKKKKKTVKKKIVWEHLPIRSEQEQIRPLHEDLQDAWERLKEVLMELGEQRFHTSHRAMMFSRHTCYAFVRPKKKYLETTFFLRESVKSPLIKKLDTRSRTKFAHVVHLVHRDQVEAPLTDWLAKAFEESGSSSLTKKKAETSAPKKKIKDE